LSNSEFFCLKPQTEIVGVQKGMASRIKSTGHFIIGPKPS